MGQAVEASTSESQNIRNKVQEFMEITKQQVLPR